MIGETNRYCTQAPIEATHVEFFQVRKGYVADFVIQGPMRGVLRVYLSGKWMSKRRPLSSLLAFHSRVIGTPVLFSNLSSTTIRRA